MGTDGRQDRRVRLWSRCVRFDFLRVSAGTTPRADHVGPIGTGGTLSGTSTFLRSRNPDVKVVLSDPEGSGLFNKVKYGVMFDIKEREGRKRRHQVDTIVSPTISSIDWGTD